MADLLAIGGAISALGHAGKIAQSFLELKSLSDVQGKVIELQSVILSAQSSALSAQSDHAQMQERVRELEKEIASMKAWGETKARYQLISPVAGVFVYALKKESDISEPPHWICEKCYGDGKKSILHKQVVTESQMTWDWCFACKACNAKYMFGRVAPIAQLV